ncbi:hypothetical protein [Streptomyces sp. NPDC006668]|uniref:hypothetical protein n=1 Tax=Streptomyces sp. NPDC006668 TaxID=3156903 RepID=UPI0033F1D480
MQAPWITEPEGGVFVFDTVVLREGVFTEELLEAVIDETLRDYLRQPGFVSARYYEGVEKGTFVTRLHWADEERWRSYQEAAGRSGTALEERIGQLKGARHTVFVGEQVAGFAGPDADEKPGYSVVTTRHVADREGAFGVHRALMKTAEWKHSCAGLIAATPYISLDGRSFLNNPTWVDQEAFDSYVAQPGLASGIADAAVHEVAPRTETFCRFLQEVGAGGE